MSTLHSFVTRTAALIAAEPPKTTTETQTLLVDRLLCALGWDVRVDCRTSVTLEGCRLEYVCSVGTVPALFVAVEAYSDGLSSDRVSALTSIMRRTGVDRAIYTNGRDALLLAGHTEIESEQCTLTDRESLDPLETYYTKDAIERHLTRHSRAVTARKLALERERLRTEITTPLVDVTGDSYQHELETVVDAFLDDLIASFAGPARVETDRPRPTVEDAESLEASEGAPPPEPAPRVTVSVTDEDIERVDGEDTPEMETETGAAEDKNEDEDEDDDEPERGEFVVRFFNDRDSIGAIGHATSEQALVYATEYLLERGLGGIRVPWPEDGDERIIAEDTDSLPAATALENGYAVNTAGTTADHATRIRALATRAGLRVMLSGDWE